MNNLIFIDTCIVIDYINGRLEINHSEIGNYCFSSIVYMEVVSGVKNKRDLNTTNKKLNLFNIIDTDQEIMNFARILLSKYVLSHGMGIYDAIISATCLIYDLPLYTHNKKDFKFIENIVLVDK